MEYTNHINTNEKEIAATNPQAFDAVDIEDVEVEIKNSSDKHKEETKQPGASYMEEEEWSESPIEESQDNNEKPESQELSKEEEEELLGLMEKLELKDTKKKNYPG